MSFFVVRRLLVTLAVGALFAADPSAKSRPGVGLAPTTASVGSDVLDAPQPPSAPGAGAPQSAAVDQAAPRDLRPLLTPPESELRLV